MRSTGAVGRGGVFVRDGTMRMPLGMTTVGVVCEWAIVATRQQQMVPKQIERLIREMCRRKITKNVRDK